MTSSRFRRSVPRYPSRFVPTAPRDLHLERRVPVQPARFVVGLEDHRELFPERVRARMVNAPQRPALYRGRVEEVGDDGELTVTVWETPGGREGVTSIRWGAPETVQLPPEGAPSPGDMLRIWTWIELGAGGSPTPRIVFEIVPTEPYPDELEPLDEALLAELVGPTP